MEDLGYKKFNEIKNNALSVVEKNLLNFWYLSSCIFVYSNHEAAPSILPSRLVADGSLEELQTTYNWPR